MFCRLPFADSENGNHVLNDYIIIIIIKNAIYGLRNKGVAPAPS